MTAIATLQRLVDVALSDARLSAWAAELIAIDPAAPDASMQLRSFYDRHIAEVRGDATAPGEDLTKCVSVDRFLMYYADADVRAEYAYGRSRGAYEHDVAAELEPSARVTADLPVNPTVRLVDALYSWVAPTDLVAGLPGAEIISKLRLRVVAPLVALELPLSHTVPAGVEVRPPCAIDTIPAMDELWEPGAVARELVDNDIPREACASARWVP